MPWTNWRDFALGPHTQEGGRFIDTQADAAALFIVRESAGRFRQIPSAAWERLTTEAQ